MIITRIGLSEVVGDSSGGMPVTGTPSTTWEAPEHARSRDSSSPIAITVMINKSDDGESPAVYSDKATVAVCDGDASRSTLNITAGSRKAQGGGDRLGAC